MSVMTTHSFQHDQGGLVVFVNHLFVGLLVATLVSIKYLESGELFLTSFESKSLIAIVHAVDYGTKLFVSACKTTAMQLAMLSLLISLAFLILFITVIMSGLEIKVVCEL